MGQAALRGNKEFRILTASDKWREKRKAIQQARDKKKSKRLCSIKEISEYFTEIKKKI